MNYAVSGNGRNYDQEGVARRKDISKKMANGLPNDLSEFGVGKLMNANCIRMERGSGRCEEQGRCPNCISGGEPEAEPSRAQTGA